MNAQVTILGLLEQGPNYGYELKKLYDNLFGQQKPILTGQVYSSLSRLRRDAKVAVVGPSAETAEASAGPERVKYQITPKGSETFHKWLNQPEEINPYLQTNLYFKVVFALLAHEDANPYLDQQLHYHVAKMREITRQRAESDDLATVLLLDNALYHIEADLRWIELAKSRIDSLKLEVINQARRA